MRKDTIITRTNVFFYGGIFSQWYNSVFYEPLIDKTFNTAEHYIMYFKALQFNDAEKAKDILVAETPAKAKSLGRQVINYNDNVWSKIRLNVSIRANYLKFTQNPELLERIWKLKDKQFVEASPYDTIWGIGLPIDSPDIRDVNKWKGGNLLGIAINKALDIIIKHNE